MTTPLGAPPVQMTMNITKGCDFQFNVNLVDNNQNPIDFGNATVYMEIDMPAPYEMQTIPATITGNVATVLIPNSHCDCVKNSTRWRVIQLDANGFHQPLMIGGFERYD